MRLVWFGFIVAIALYLWMGETMPGFSWLTFPNAGKTFVALAVFYLLSFAWARKKLYCPALALIQSQPDNTRAVRRWVLTWTILVSFAGAESILGWAFRMGGKTLKQSLPFYMVGSVLIVWLWPRPVWSAAKTANQ